MPLSTVNKQGNMSEKTSSSGTLKSASSSLFLYIQPKLIYTSMRACPSWSTWPSPEPTERLALLLASSFTLY